MLSNVWVRQYDGYEYEHNKSGIFTKTEAE